MHIHYDLKRTFGCMFAWDLQDACVTRCLINDKHSSNCCLMLYIAIVEVQTDGVVRCSFARALRRGGCTSSRLASGYKRSSICARLVQLCVVFLILFCSFCSVSVLFDGLTWIGLLWFGLVSLACPGLVWVYCILLLRTPMPVSFRAPKNTVFDKRGWMSFSRS